MQTGHARLVVPQDALNEGFDGGRGGGGSGCRRSGV